MGGTEAKVDIFDDNWFTYFFNESNHKAGIKPPAFVTYHFYAIPGSFPKYDPWPLGKNTPMGEWSPHLFKQAALFIKRAQHVNALVAAGSFGAFLRRPFCLIYRLTSIGLSLGLFCRWERGEDQCR